MEQKIAGPWKEVDTLEYRRFSILSSVAGTCCASAYRCNEGLEILGFKIFKIKYGYTVSNNEQRPFIINSKKKYISMEEAKIAADNKLIEFGFKLLDERHEILL